MLKSKPKSSPIWLNALAAILVPTIFMFTCEWIHRGTLGKGFFSERFFPHFSAFFISWLLLIAVYILILFISSKHFVATFLTGILSNVPAIVTNFKLDMRGEPFLPWDILQLEDFLGVASKVKLEIQPPMIFSSIIFVCLVVGAWFVKMPMDFNKLKPRLIVSGGSFLFIIIFINAVFLNGKATEAIGIYPDMWMQDRYYKNHGVITGFLTNLQALKIVKPEDYNEETINTLKKEIEENAKTRNPLYFKDIPNEKTPNIIYVMNESFWDVTRLDGIEFDSELTPNLKQMKQEGASGYCYTPSFGGGTCDVEFEALTGFSVENLPSGSKPYQQHITQDSFSIAQYLKQEKGYQTLAIHGYYRKFWSRNVAYPRLGIDEFIAYENFANPEKRRGYISDMEMTNRIISEYENKSSGAPLFIHAVTMQNHTTYDKKNYDSNELVQVTKSPTGMSEQTIGQLQDFATGVKEADAALGKLLEYFRNQNEPTIIVFWGDHFNPVGKGFELYEKTGFINMGDGASNPNLHKTDLAIWSNYETNKIELGTIASYNISPVVTELYNLDKPLLFEYLLQQLPEIKARTRGVIINPDNSSTDEMSEIQQQYAHNHSLLQYDLMFGEPYLNTYAPKED